MKKRRKNAKQRAALRSLFAASWWQCAPIVRPGIFFI